MGKHSLDKNTRRNTTANNDKFYGRIIARQGEKLIQLEDKVKSLQGQLVQERSDRIEDLQEINYLATCNNYNNDKSFLKKIAEISGNKLEVITGGIIKMKKELSSNTDQSIKN